MKPRQSIRNNGTARNTEYDRVEVRERTRGRRVGSSVEASGFLVGPPVFKTGEAEYLGLAGSIPVRLRHMPIEEY